MKTDESRLPYPSARTDDVLVEEFDDECVVYDERVQEAHRLNRVASVVWRHCDGRRSPEDLGRILSEETDLPDPEAAAELALARLDDVGLLRRERPGNRERTAEETRGAQGRLDRRSALKRMGGLGAAAAALPLVTSVMAPTPAMARSGGGSGGSDDKEDRRERKGDDGGDRRKGGPGDRGGKGGDDGRRRKGGKGGGKFGGGTGSP